MSVVFTAQSSRQMDKALAYIRDKSPSGADNVSERITESIDLLERHPHSGRPTTRRDIRRLGLTPYPYVMLYRIVGDDVVVIRFLHAARRSA